MLTCIIYVCIWTDISVVVPRISLFYFGGGHYVHPHIFSSSSFLIQHRCVGDGLGAIKLLILDSCSCSAEVLEGSAGLTTSSYVPYSSTPNGHCTMGDYAPYISRQANIAFVVYGFTA